MDTPSLIFYEHNLDDSQVQSLAKSVLNLGNECRAWAEENARLKALTVEMDKTINASQAECRRLKAEVERLTAFTTRTIIPNEVLQAEVERLNNLIISGGAVNPDASVYQ
jgi:predicted RNase H-like nuclease (RuvC/YqgF family)